jgi:large subunit ribosomal protein L33
MFFFDTPRLSSPCHHSESRCGGDDALSIHPGTDETAFHNERTLTYFLNAAKSRTIAVRLISMAMTGYYRTMIRPRLHRPLSMLKYDPVVKKKVLFLEATKGGKAK